MFYKAVNRERESKESSSLREGKIKKKHTGLERVGAFQTGATLGGSLTVEPIKHTLCCFFSLFCLSIADIFEWATKEDIL